MGKEKTLKEYLVALPKQALMRLTQAENRKIISVSGLIADVLRQYGQPAFLSQLIRSLAPECRALLRLVLFEGKSGADALQIADHFSKAGVKEECLALLQEKFLVYGVKSVPFRYYVFPELRPALEAMALEEGLAAVRRLHPGKDRRGCGDSLFRDLRLFLLFLAGGPVKKTKNGLLNKKQMEGLFSLLENRMEFPGGGEGESPSLFRILRQFAVKKELAEEDGEKLALSQKGLKWLDLDGADQATEWYAFVFSGCREEKARLVLSLLRKADAPLHAGDAVDFFFSRSARDGRPMPEVFEWLFHAGLIDLVNGAQGAAGFGLSKRGGEVLEDKKISVDSARQITVLPTFELLVPRILETKLARRLFGIARIGRSDALITLKLCRESLYDGLNAGLDAGEIVPFLASVSQHGIPQNVRYSLEEWIGAYGSASFESHFMLRVKKEEAFRKIRSILSGSKYRYEELPPVGFSIQYSDYNEIFQILTRLGFTPRPFLSPAPLSGGGGPRNILEGYLRLFPGPAPEEEEFLFPEGEGGALKPRENGKYGGKFKKLPYNELVHVLNYSILMEQKIEAELKNEKGRLLLYPEELVLHASEPLIKGRDGRTNEKTEIKINDIDKIRVEK